MDMAKRPVEQTPMPRHQPQGPSRVLAHTLLTQPGRSPQQWLFVLHGMFGAGRNWRTVANQMVQVRPDWGVILVDLRMHGDSQDFPPPHTLRTAAGDLAVLRHATGLRTAGILGHSFGAKVALQYATDDPQDLRQVWIVDASPSAGEPAGTAWRMLEAVRTLPAVFASRDSAVDALRQAGFAPGLAQWMATNLKGGDSGYAWKLDFGALRAMLEDYFRTDLWAAIEHPPAGMEVHVLKATESDAIDDAAEARLRSISSANGRVFLHRVEGGHWLNVDNRDALVGLLSRALP
jgi:esterase